MAEIGLIASVLGIASAGIKLSTTLYAFSETVSTAHDDVKNIARDVSLISSVLDELAANLKSDEQAKLYSGTALVTAQTVVKDCEGVFAEIEAAMKKAMERMSKREFGVGEKKKKGGKVVLSALEKLKWPFLQPKMELLRVNLEQLKSTLVLMLNVLIYARQVQIEQKKKPPKDDYQRILIESLVQANRVATKNFQALLRTIGSGENEISKVQQDTKPPSQTGSSSQDQPRSLDELSMSPLSSYAAAPPAYITAMASNTDALPEPVSTSLKSAAAEIVLAAELAAACLKRIGKTLNQFDRSKHASAYPARLSIELLQELGSAPGKVLPWTVLSITEQRRAPSPIREEPYDPYGGHSPRLSRPVITRALQAKIDDTVGVMRENVNKVSQRGEKLHALQDKTANLSSSARACRRGANRVRAQQSWLATFGRAWNYVPSPIAVVSSIQAAIDATLSTSQEDDDEMVADSYSPSVPVHASADPDSSTFSPKPITHSPTFDDILGTGKDRNDIGVSSEPGHSHRQDRPAMGSSIGADDHRENVTLGGFVLVNSQLRRYNFEDDKEGRRRRSGSRDRDNMPLESASMSPSIPLQQPQALEPLPLRDSRSGQEETLPILPPDRDDDVDFAATTAAGAIEAPTLKLWEAARATSAAPTCFPPATCTSGPSALTKSTGSDEEADGEPDDEEEHAGTGPEVEEQGEEEGEVDHLLKEWTTLYE